MTNQRNIPTDPRERRAWVQYQLKLLNQSLASIARAHGWKATSVHQALYRPSYRQEQALAAVLEVEVHELFPDRYDRKGNRLHIVRPRRPAKRKKVAA